MAGRHCIHCGAALTGARFCINCGAISDDSSLPSRDERTLTDVQIPAPHRAKRTVWVGIAVLALVATGAALWLLRPASTDANAGNIDSSPQATSSPTGTSAPTPDATPTAPGSPSPTSTPEPSSLPTRGPLTTLTPQSVSASCEGQPGFDSRRFLVTLDGQSLVDGRSDTAWRCTYREDTNGQRWDPAKNRGVGESVTFFFASPVAVVGARFIPGYTKIDPYDGTNRYAQNGRPVLVEWQFGDSGVVRQEVRLKPPGSRPTCKTSGAVCILGEGWWSGEARNPSPSTLVDFVTLTILEIESGSDPQLANSAAISEVEIIGYS